HRNYKKVLYSTHENPKNATRIEKYQIIDILKKEYPVSKLCDVLQIVRQSYYKWLKKTGNPL
ncbi:hypothetical protein PT226_08760, partial [Erysipelothrix rhusiopathiae]|nr:hypothetical protein [Erysipelothrix rhusiopathiae]